jgi:phage baseplate assembly protein W
MANGVTYGINFPFGDSLTGKYLNLSETPSDEIRNNLIHLLLTRKGSRYFLPDFGTRLYEYIFEPLDGPTFADVESEIRDSVEKYIPGIQILNIEIKDASEGEENKGTFINSQGEREFTVQGIGEKEHTAKIKINYRITNQAFESTDFVIINI